MKFAVRSGLFCAASIIAATASATTAMAQTNDVDASVMGAIDEPAIVIRDGINPNANPPAGSFDNATDRTGIGQVVTSAGGGSVGTCTGTLINPRTVLFAAHCVNTQAATTYGSATGGTPISVGFSFYNLPALRQWLGLDGGTLNATNVAGGLYNVEQVWYDQRSLSPASQGFLEGDIALATLDTPAFGIPTWAMLFSPLTGPEHAMAIGYGQAGTGTTGGTNTNLSWRRRAAENMLDFLGSLDDRNLWLFGAPAGLPQNIYAMDFDDPKYGQAGANPYDFNIFGGSALPREGITGPGDSGGPLIIDQKWSRPVVAGTLSGGSRFYGAQPGSSYGTHNIYQPLFLFWDAIVANNAYVYANAKAGNGDWGDPAHWVQAMDPNYMVERGGALINDLPDTPALGVTGNSVQFGKVCFRTDCTTPQGVAPAVGSGKGLIIVGGPGSTGFVPNNVVANPGAGIKSRYYDVTLNAQGITALGSAVTIDRFTIDGPSGINVKSTGSLKVWGDYTQGNGWTNIDGSVKSGEMLIARGLLTGSGIIDPTYLSVVKGIVAPGGVESIGKLTVKGDVVLSSGSTLLINANRNGASQLSVVGDAANSGILALNGGAVYFNKAAGPAPRHGDSFVIASATGGINGTFGTIGTFQGVLRPELSYGPNAITAFLRAGSLQAVILKGDATSFAFAGALDSLREKSYDKLYGLYGAIDVMGPQALSGALAGLNPRLTGETKLLQDRQSDALFGTVTNRLSMLGTGSASGLSITGSPASLIADVNAVSATNSQHRFAGLTPATQRIDALPKGVTGFISSGVTSSTSGYGAQTGNNGQQSLYYGMGLETQIADGLTFGSAFGYAKGTSNASLDRAGSTMNQLAAYGSYRLGGGAYLGVAASVDSARVTQSRFGTDGLNSFALDGATRSVRYSAVAEAGVNLPVARGLTATPRVQLGYADYSLSGFTESGGETALALDDIRLRRLESRIGAKLSGSTPVAKGWSFVPQIEADYVHLLSGTNNGMTVRFAAADDVAIALPFAGGDSSWAEIKGGMRLTNGPVEVGAGVQASVGRANTPSDERAMANVTLRF